jgi:hypothetical protein
MHEQRVRRAALRHAEVVVNVRSGPGMSITSATVRDFAKPGPCALLPLKQTNRSKTKGPHRDPKHRFQKKGGRGSGISGKMAGGSEGAGLFVSLKICGVGGGACLPRASDRVGPLS